MSLNEIRKLLKYQGHIEFPVETQADADALYNQLGPNEKSRVTFVVQPTKESTKIQATIDRLEKDKVTAAAAERQATVIQIRPSMIFKVQPPGDVEVFVEIGDLRFVPDWESDRFKREE